MNDLISRQAAIDKADSLYRDTKNDECYMITGYNHAISDIRAILKSLPSAQPERKTGEWLELTNTNHTYVCSVCGRMLVNITDGKNTVTKNYPFCHCGADMRGKIE